MLVVSGHSFPSCDGLSRPNFLRAGFLGLAGLSLSDLLRAQQALGEPGKGKASDRSVILVWLDGGPPQHETYDAKPEAPETFRGPLEAIDTAIPGVQISELLPEHARLMKKLSLIRTLPHNNGDHFAAAHWMLTGYLGATAANTTPVNPSAGSVVSKLLGSKKPGIPA